jgi:hypothetical protein
MTLKSFANMSNPDGLAITTVFDIGLQLPILNAAVMQSGSESEIFLGPIE